MIVFLDKKIVLYTPPRCASTAMWDYFGKRGDALLIAGPGRDGSVNHHFSSPISGYADYKQVVVVRKPLDRLCSLFRFQVFHGTNEPFDGYIERLVNMRVKCSLYGDNIDTYLELVKETDVVHFDSIEADLRKLGILAVDEVLPASNRYPWESPKPTDITPEQVESLKFWWEPDCKRFNIEMR